MSRTTSLTCSATSDSARDSLNNAISIVQGMIDDGTLDREADRVEADRRAVIQAALAGPPGGDYEAGLQIVVYTGGEFVVTQPRHVWELEADPDYFCTISLAAITVAVAKAMN